jgi:archaellum component FlaF (FlaF/FlaG flagellin family)
VKKQAKIVAAIILLLVVVVGGYWGHQEYNQYKKVQASYTMTQKHGGTVNNTDKTIVNEVLKNNDLEYAYITHSGNTVMLTIKFKTGIQDKIKSAQAIKYMAQLKSYYGDKNINVKTMPSS